MLSVATTLVAGCHLVSGLDGFGADQPTPDAGGAGGVGGASTSSGSVGGAPGTGGEGGAGGSAGGGEPGCVVPGTDKPCTGEVEAVRIFSAEEAADDIVVRDIHVDGTGAIYLVGESFGRADLGFGAEGETGTNNGFALKLDRMLTSEWRQVVIGVDYQSVRAVDTNADGSQVALGINFEGEATLDGVYFDNLQLNVTDSLLAKLDGDGNLTWARHFSGSGFDRLRDVAIDAQGRIAYAGYFAGGLFVPGEGSVYGGDDGMLTRQQAFVGVRQADGSALWQSEFGVPAEDEGIRKLESLGTTFIAAGYFDGSVDFGLGVLQAVDDEDAAVVQFDGGTGLPAWQTRFYGDDSEFIQGLAQCPNGDLVVGGMFQSSFFIANEMGSHAVPSGWEMFWARLDAQGVWLQSDDINGSREDFSYGNVVACGPDGRIVVGGAFNGPLEYGGAVPVQGDDGFVSKLDPDGSPVWTQVFSGNGDIEVLNVKTALDGSVVVVGHFTGEATFGTQTVIASARDVFVVRLAP